MRTSSSSSSILLVIFIIINVTNRNVTHSLRLPSITPQYTTTPSKSSIPTSHHPTIITKPIITHNKSGNIKNRRNALFKITSTTATIFTPFQASNAATPMTTSEADNVSARGERNRRSKPTKTLRPNLNMDFAVLLMRSSYNAIDDLDCVPMDQFQKDFFLIRQAEYLPYTNALGPGLVKQGQLDDPLYFDFISFAQYAAISRDITQNPQVVFEELQPEEEFTKNGTFIQQRFVTNVVRRDSSLMDNNLLPIRFDEIVGGKIIDRIIGETPSAFPSSITDGSKPNVNVVLLSMKQLVKTFLGYGFAFSGKVEMTPSSNGAAPGTEFVITLSAPATLWSGRALQQRKAKPCNDFILKASKVLLKKAGYGKVSTSLKYTNAQEISTIVLR